ncbi:hypothetical protein [Candidatus Thiodictyon syntrophicum]|jgi:hypothetical protein|uniref:hypothetical protein n=1 Tax=Candidatus Thiodictyon syntrophicum TaxID=1166950 RepID=UPI0012FDB816|nr:hypothetical protein [Candidatus Thiodictyon syntrophicum]
MPVSPAAATLPALVLGTTAGATGVASALLIPGTLAHPPIDWQRRLPLGLLVGAAVGSGGYSKSHVIAGMGISLLPLPLARYRSADRGPMAPDRATGRSLWRAHH